jgi:hypothetical protein
VFAVFAANDLLDARLGRERFPHERARVGSGLASFACALVQPV